MSEIDAKSAGDTKQSLYASREKIYPRQVHGLFAAMRTLGVLVLLGMYYIIPWLQWDGRQMVLFDLPARKFYIFGLVFWPQDFFYLALLLIVAALSLFFFTAIAGRLWCGYSCPQTVWTEVFLWIEHMVEGSRPKQIKRDKAPMSFSKFRVKATKHVIWIVFALFTGLTFVGYFSPIRHLTHEFFEFHMGPWETFWVFFYGFATYGNAGFLREQVCTYMCPYARFQSVMIDADTLVISYDAMRGDPRGGRKKSADPKQLGLGDCIDCTICVQVCPTGIDIRNGLQYECIGCAACIDACDNVMEEMGYAKGLIRYTTENALEGKVTHFIRPRTVIYALVLVSIISGVIFAMATRTPLALDVVRDRNTLYRETDDGRIENVYTLKIMNKDEKTHHYDLAVSGLKDLSVLMDTKHITVKSGNVVEVPVRVRVEEDELHARSSDLVFKLTASDASNLSATQNARFIGPLPEGDD